MANPGFVVTRMYRVDLKRGDVIQLSDKLDLVYVHGHGHDGPSLKRNKFEIVLDTNVVTFIWTDKSGRHRNKELNLSVPKSKWQNHYWLVTDVSNCGESYNGGIWTSQKVTLERVHKSGKRYDPIKRITLTARQNWWRESLDAHFTMVGRMKPTYGPFVKLNGL